MKTSKIVVKSGCSESICDGERKFCFEIKEECKGSCVTIIMWSILVQKCTNILIFYILEYGAEYGAECSAESCAK